MHTLPQEVVDSLSADRLSGFRVQSGRNDSRALLGRYLHNVAVSHALYPSLHALEVVLRNRIHSAVEADCPIDRDRPDLYRTFPTWLDAVNSILTPDHQREVGKASDSVLKDIRRRFRGKNHRDRSRHTPGRLVAKLPFSFWVFLFDKEYVGIGRGDPGVLWPRYSEAVFPNDPPEHIHKVRSTLRRMLVIRNRVMHHERIIPWEDYEDTALSPVRVQEDILQLLAMMSAGGRDTLYEHGPGDYMLKPSFGRYLTIHAARL
jgi:hypothetical protein